MNIESDRNEKVEIYQKYYQVSLRLGLRRERYVSIFTVCNSSENNFELRSADSVKAYKTIKAFDLPGYHLTGINTKRELTTFLKVGGHALLSGEVIDKSWPEIKIPKKVIDTFDRGFLEYNSLSSQDKERFARRNLRMQVLKRDNFQCRLCGASPDDNVHVRLDAHHIKP